jgi:hypothetical protein
LEKKKVWEWELYEEQEEEVEENRETYTLSGKHIHATVEDQGFKDGVWENSNKNNDAA